MDSESIEIAGRKVTKADWDATPESVKLAIEDFHGIVGVLTQRISNLEEKLNKNSKNSSIPPSKNGFGGGKKVERKEVKRATKRNPGKKRGWLWVVVTPLVSFFTVALSRSQATAQAILGNYTGLVGSDRCPSYGWLENDHRQVCWAHLLRDFQAMAERSGASAEIGVSLLNKGHRLFHWWHRVRDGTMSRELFVEATNLLRAAVKAELESAINLGIGRTETTPLAKTVRTCEQLLKIEAAMWTFVDHQDLEPTNNIAERALRPAVIWRNTSFGSQSQGGSEFVARMLTVSSSLKSQGRSVLDFLTQSCQAYRLGTTPPTLIPLSEPTFSNERIIIL